LSALQKKREAYLALDLVHGPIHEAESNSISCNHNKQAQHSLKLTTIHKNLLKFTKIDDNSLKETISH
jgi:hypothetical protein